MRALPTSLMAGCLAVIFALLAGIHVYWLAGGRFGLGAVLPTSRAGGPPLFRPSPIATAAVGGALLVACGLSVATALGVVSPLLASAHLGIALLFLLRAVGDFRYLGLFKRVTGTTFALWDTRLYVPLCLVVFALSLAVGVAGFPRR